MKKLRIGLVGAGNIAKTHMKILDAIYESARTGHEVIIK